MRHLTYPRYGLRLAARLACPRRGTGLDHDRYSEAPAQTVLVAGVDYIGVPAGNRCGAR